MAKNKKKSPHFQTDLTLIRSVPAREEWITKKTQKRFTPNYHATIHRTAHARTQKLIGHQQTTTTDDS